MGSSTTIIAPWQATIGNGSTNGWTISLSPVTSLPTGVYNTVKDFLCILPYGVGADDTAFTLRVIGYRRGPGFSNGTPHWVPTVLSELLCTLSATTGTIGLIPADTNQLADTIVQATGYPTGSRIVSPTGDVPGHAIVDLEGCERFILDINTGASATSGNALIAQI